MLLLQRHPGPDCRYRDRGYCRYRVCRRAEQTRCRMLARPRLILVAMLRGIEADAIVPDRELQSAVQAPQTNLRPARLSVACDIAQALLRDAKQAERHVARQLAREFRRRSPPVESSRSAKSARTRISTLRIKPRSSRMEGCSRYDSACTSSLNRAKPSRIVRMAAPPAGLAELRSSRPASIASKARRCVTSSCSSRARRARSSSCAWISRPLSSCAAASERRRLLLLVEQPKDQRGLQQHRSTDRQNLRADIAPIRSDRESGSRFPAADGSRRCPSAAFLSSRTSALQIRRAAF